MATSESQTAEEAPEAYTDLLEEYERVSLLQDAGMVLSWDQQVMMPEGGTPARSKQTSTLSGLGHELLTSDEFEEALAAAEEADLSDRQAAAVREIKRKHRRAARVPRDLVEETSKTSTEAMEAWEQAREEDDFSIFAPYLEKLVDLKRKEAEHIDPDRDPYEVLFENYEPYLGVDTAERVLSRLRDELVPLIEAISESDADLARPFEGETFDADAQEDFSRDVLDGVGYDWDRGRLDVSAHPFTSGTQFDCRVTTRFDEEDPLGGIMATVHEFGHARYNLGLPQEEYGTPLGESRDMTVHESQSRFWENHVGRTKAFWHRFLGDLRERFPQLEDAGVEDLYEAANRVYDDNLIRVEADELTYHMHIVVRFEIEKALIRGELEVEDVPEVWNDKYEEYLGLRPETDAMGCLQDIHWSHGSFGYFPTYSLGSVLAAQLDAALRDDLENVDAKIREGEFDPIADWHQTEIHDHGSRYTTDDLVERATGESFTADYFLEYAKSKYGELYDLDEYGA